MDAINIILIIGGLVAAAVVCMLCLVGLIVWVAGGEDGASSQAWRHADKS